VSIASNSEGDAGAGITATDFGDVSLATTKLVITNNDGRNSAFALIIIRDGSGGTANATGAVLRENLGVNLVNGATTSVSNRSIHTLEECDSSGVCQPAHRAPQRGTWPLALTLRDGDDGRRSLVLHEEHDEFRRTGIARILRHRVHVIG